MAKRYRFPSRKCRMKSPPSRLADSCVSSSRPPTIPISPLTNTSRDIDDYIGCFGIVGRQRPPPARSMVAMTMLGLLVLLVVG